MAETARAPGSPRRPLDAGTRDRIERWFVERGVPQFIDGYSSEQSMDARAAPLIAGWLVIGTLLGWGIRSDRPAVWYAATVVATLLFMAAAYLATLRLRGRPLWTRPERYDLLDIATFGALPVLPAAVIDASPLAAIVAGLNALLGIGIIYIVIAFGLIEIGLWAIRRLTRQVGHIVSLLSRTLPLLLILVVFLLFASEIWEAAHGLGAHEVAATLLLLLIIAVLLVLTTFRTEIQRLDASDDWTGIRGDARETPATSLVDAMPEAMPRLPRLGWLQRRNLDFLVLINQLPQAIFVASLVMAFLVAFGALALPASLQERWVGEPVTILLRFELLGEVRTVSAELLTVSALLSGIVGLYFTGLALTDATYRAEHVTSVVSELRRLLAARAVYLAALGRER